MVSYIRLLSLPFTLIFSTLTFGQVLNLGIKGGLGVSSNIGKIEESEVKWNEYQNIASGYYCVGAYGEFSTSKKWRFHFELLYGHSGAGKRFTTDTSEVIQNDNFNAFQIPAMFAFQVNEHLFWGLGAQFNFLLSSSSLYRLNGSVLADYEKIKSERHNSLTYGPVFMVGAKVDKWQFGGNFHVGINSPMSENVTAEVGIKNFTASVFTTYRLFTSDKETIQFYNHQNY
ncbi:MAG: outer membrane beta-barrel protein [Cytophagaceae bacterium]|jgi:hypothetical protein|nr:outer membrane beta-barrel protein [Cytophagaceae bacterium]